MDISNNKVARNGGFVHFEVKFVNKIYKNT
nr:MAG TPA: hypothetical protein [Caudoviricetes sp.]